MARRLLHLSRGDPVHQQLDYVTNQTRYLLANSIVDFSQTDGLENAPNIEQLQRPDTTNWQPSEYGREIGRAIKFIVADIDKEKEYQALADKVPINAEHEVISRIASNIFSDGQFNWGRVVFFFYFAYRLCCRCFSNISLIRDIIETIVQYMRDHVVSWIIQMGGWEAILEYVSSRKKILFAISGTIVATCLGIAVYQKYLS